ncbi:MAG: PKD domain-containing protein [Bacteroidia bacterium]
MIRHLLTTGIFFVISFSSIAQNYLMSNTNVSTCAGNFYDSGGGGANYGLNQNTTMTLCSNTAGQCIRVSFTAFNLENSFDFLRIYNGPNTASPLIGSYTGTTSPGVVTGTSGCLTFVFTSDGSINHAGWTASISCVTCAAGGSCLQTCNGGPAPANDACSGAQNLGMLPAPAACPNGIGSWVNVSTTNLCATAEMPYTTLTGCNPSGNMASPAADVWYRLNLTGPTLNVQISGGIQTPNLALYAGTTCNNLVGRGCAIGAGGILNTSFGGLAAGTYYLQVSGGNLNDQCDFNLALQNNFDCQGCVIVNNLVVNPPPVNGTYQAGQLVNFCYTISDYNQTSVNWLHAVVPTFGAGWDMSTLTTVMPANCSGAGAWGWYNTNITSSATGVIHGPGFYYESGLGSPLGFMDGNPGNNFGDNNATNSCNWTFCFSVRTMPASQCTQGASLNVSIDTYGDGESGSWTSLACTGDPVTDFFATLACCQPPIVNPNNPLCDGYVGSANGIAQGVSPWTYIWQNSSGGTMMQVNNINSAHAIPNLAAGNYSLTTIDNNGCSSTTYFSITTPPAIVIAANAIGTKCNSNDGAINIFANGGVAPLQYSIDNGTTFSAASVFNNLAAGSYTVVVKDANGCTSSQVVSVAPSSTPVINSSPVTQVSCFGGNNGNIVVNAAGGNPPLQYSIDNGTTYQASNSFTTLTAGTYSVVVSDVDGCTSSVTLNVTQPAQINISNVLTTDATCGNSNGSLVVTASGGTGALQYSITGGVPYQASNTFNNLAAANYNVVVIDANGCTQTINAQVNNSSAPVINATNATSLLCNGDNNASITINASGGTGALQFSINNGTTFQSGNVFNGLVAGTYNVVVSDAVGCLVSTAIVIADPPVLSISANNVGTTCTQSNGSITASGGGGSGVLQYAINGGSYQPSTNFNNLAAGNYTVTVQDANGCTASTTTNITDAPSAVIVNITTTPVGCNGQSDGTVDIVANSGTAPLNYSIDNGLTFQAGSFFSGLAAGSYSIVVSDANGCTTTSSINVVEPTTLILNLNSVNTTCSQTNGSVSAIANGGTPAYQFSIDAGVTFQASASFGGLATGVYSIVVQDANGCTASGSINISDAPGPHIDNVASVDINCNGANSGSVTITASNGTTPLQFSIDNGTTYQSGNVFNSLSPGSYNIVVQDANGCTTTATANITEPTAVVISGTPVTDVNCNGANNGSITINANGGAGTLQYSIDNGSTYQASNTFSSLSPGSYNIVVQDANGCTATGTANITEPTAVVISGTPVTDANCNGANNGSITINANGGTGTLQYSIDNGATYQSGNVFSSLSPGSYNIVVQDANGCTTTATANITEPTAVVINGTPVTDANCNGANNGAITINANGGTGTLQYSIDNGVTYQASITFSSLSPGSYNIVVQDANGCTTSVIANITEPTALSFSSVVTDANCGNANGGVTINASGGTSPIQYSIDNGATFQTGNNFSGLLAGSYQVQLQDANGCTFSGVISIQNLAAPVINQVVYSGLTCNASNDGTITINASGGTGALQYSIDNGITFSTIFNYSNLSGGSYSLVVQDGAGCQAVFAVVLLEPTVLSVSPVVSNTTCSLSNGNITLNANGGTSPYSFSINNGANFQPQNIFSSIASGNYTVLITDANGCSVSQPLIVNDAPSPVISNVQQTNISCNGSSDGGVQILTNGGTAPLQYSIDNGSNYQALNNFSNLSAGNYNLIVQDANGCTATATVQLSQPSAIVLNPASIPSTCGNDDGTVTITASGGTGAFNYSIDNGLTYQPSNTFGQLYAGNYTVTVQDANGCTGTIAVAVNNLSAPSIQNLAPTNITCNGSDNGTITVSASGGTGALSYSIDNGASYQSGSVFQSLPPGNYNVVVQDGNGCTVTSTAIITEPLAIQINSTATNTTCGNSNGSIDIQGSGGTGVLTYSNNGGTNFQPSGLFGNVLAGTYQLVVTDGNGCTATSQVVVTDAPSPVIANTPLVQISCNGLSDGSITINTLGGLAPLQYSIDNGTTTQSSGLFSNLSPGNYQIIVTDANGCTATSSAMLNQPLGITASASTVNANCGTADGTITITASGGSGTLQYSIDNGISFQSASSFGFLVAGNYNVIVRDANGCTNTVSTTVSNNSAPSISVVSATDITCFGAGNGTISVSANGGSGILQYSINNGASFQTSQVFNNVVAGTYTVVVQDAGGCTVTDVVSIAEPSMVIVNNTTSGSTCGLLNGLINISANGGTSPFQFSIDSGITFQSTATFSGLASGNYQLLVQDANGCTINSTTQVADAPSPQISQIAHTDLTCFGSQNGTISIASAGGTSPVMYSIDGGTQFQAGAVFSNLISGSYQILIQDANGCTATSSVLVAEPSAIAVTSVTTDATCGNSNGSLIINTIGGSGVLTYSIDSGLNFQSNSLFQNLLAGTYNIIVQDANGCTSSANAVVSNASAPVINATPATNVSCNGYNDGSISIAASGGLGTLTYSINGGITSFPSGIFSNLIAGSYNILVTDSAGCTVTAVANITQPTAILSSTAVVNAICGSTNGEITITASGGVGTLQYSIDNGGSFQPGNIFNSLGAGNYQIVVSDANGCTIGAVVSVNNTNAPVIQSTNVTNVSCFGGNNGSIIINANGGTGVLQYSINNVVTYSLNNTYTSLPPGSYSIQVVDAAGCIATSNVLITEPDELLFNTTSTPSTCGNANGQLTFNAIGGTAPLQYSVNNGSSFQSGVGFSGLTAANYSVVIQDANGCSASAVATITNQAGPTSANVVANDVKCNGVANGIISIYANGGTGILQYSINNGSLFQQGNIFSGLSTGTYQIVIQDANGCSITAQSVINEPDAITLSVVESGSICSQPNGSINVSANGGTGTLQYSANNGLSFQASSYFINLSAGNYNIIVQDSNGCTSQMPATVTDAPSPVLQNISVTNVLCYGNSNGFIRVQTNGGTGVLNYALSNGDVNSSGTFDSLTWGNYTVIVTDANGCTVSGNTTVTQPQPLNFFVNTTASTCGNSNGIITINNLTGGTGVCVYSLDSGLTNQSQNQFVNMSAGNYAVLVTDSNGCSLQSNVLLANVAGPLFDGLNITDALCSGSANGAISVSPQGGTGPFLFSADSGLSYQAGNIFSALSAGNYNLIIQDANGCLTDSVVTINEPLPLNYQVASAVATCGSSNGTITLNATGGNGGYQYSINNGITFQSAGTFGGLIPAGYPVVVTDMNGCLDSGLVNVADAPSPVLSIVSVNDATCNGYADGVVAVVSQSGTLPIQYNINGGLWQQSGNFANLSSGNYSVIVQDSYGCADTVTALIAEPLAIMLQTSTIPVICNGQSNGQTSVTVTGGTLPYSYQWSGGATTSAMTNLSAGTYSVIITDSHNCTSSASAVVTEPTALQMTLATTPVTCFGYSNGIINTTASGGTGNLQFSIDTGTTYQNSTVFTSLPFGNYSVQVADANGCTLSVPVNMTQPSAVTLTSNTVDVKCFGGNDGSLTANANGGTAPYQFVINNGNPQGGATFNNLTAGNYIISVADSKGCLKTISDSVGQPNALNAVASGQNVLCNGQSNGAVNVIITGGVQPYLYQWTGGYTTSLVNNLPQGNYQVTVTDFNGCTIQSSASITQPTAINLGLTPDPTICVGQSASVTANANGGTPPYVFKWNTGHIGATLQASPVITTSYNVFLTDSNGCNSPLRYANINVNPVLALVITDGDTLCEGQSTTLTATPSGGNGGPYIINWNGQAQSTSSITVTPLQTTNYVATLTDGCTVLPATASTVVVVNPLPQVVFVPLATEGCVPLTVDFQNMSSNGSSWQWTFGDGDKDTLVNPSHTYTQAGTYSVGLYAVSNAGCENQLILDDAIQVYENPQAAFTSNRVEASILDPWFEFRNLSVGASTYLWDFGDNRTLSTDVNPMYVYGDTGTYQIVMTATSEHQCSDTAYGEVHVSGAVTVYIPNAFTPNSDGRNELFSVSGIGYTELQMIIFDRWGNMLFNQTSSNPGWNGMNMFNNSMCQQGVYVYKVIVKNIFNKQQEFKGTVSLLR